MLCSEDQQGITVMQMEGTIPQCDGMWKEWELVAQAYVYITDLHKY